MRDSLDYLTGFDFSLLDDPSFKEDSVREELIKHLLNALGYSVSGEDKIVRSKALQHPFIQAGSTRRPITHYPDYILQVSGQDKWVLDAKAPNEAIESGANVEQAFFYAIHPEVNVPIFALCNGREFIAFKVSDKMPILHFHLSELSKHWSTIQSRLSPSAFSAIPSGSVLGRLAQESEFDYMAIKPLGEIRAIQKQSASRHFGVHGYFTKQP